MQTIQDSTPDGTRPLISFIIPYYNRPVEMLRKCVESILATSLKKEEREIIIVDDGSESSALPHLGELASLITYLRKENGGLGDARNTGLDTVTGEYVQFIDDDDHLLPSAYNHCIEIARKQHPDMVMFRFSSEETTTEDYTDAPPVSGTEYMLHHNLRGSVWTFLFRRRILGELRFTKGIYHEDDEFTPLLLLRTGSLIATNAYAYFYYIHPNSIITRKDFRSIEKRLHDTLYIINSLAEKRDKLPAAQSEALRRRVNQLTMAYIYNVIVQKRSKIFLERAINELRRMQLFPLPIHDYTRRYKWFCRIANVRPGRLAMLLLLPHIHH